METNSNEQAKRGASESHWDPATTCSLSEAQASHLSSEPASPQSPFRHTLQHIRERVRLARTLVKEAFEHSTDVYWSVPTVDLSEELWEVFHPLMTIGDRLDSVQSELELVDVGYQQFLASQQAPEGVVATPLLSLQETVVDPPRRQEVQPLAFVVHVTVGTRFGRPFSVQEAQELMERYRGHLIEQQIIALQGTTRSVVSFFADLKEVVPVVASDLSEDAIGFCRIRKPSLSEYPAALRFLRQRTAVQTAEDQQDSNGGDRLDRQQAGT
jgi:hypothetical protein